MTLEETIKRYKKHSECIQQTLITKVEAMNVYGWLKELKAYRDTYKNYSKVEKMLICEVEKAKENPSVKKPISYGLYQTWKFWDKNEVVREVNADDSNGTN